MDKDQKFKEFVEGMKLLAKSANSLEGQESRRIVADALARLPDDKIIRLCQLAKEELDNEAAGKPVEQKVLSFFANVCAPLLPQEIIRKLAEMNYIIFNLRVSGMVRKLMREWDGWKQPSATPS